MGWSTSLKGLDARRLARLLGDEERRRVGFSLASVDAWQRELTRDAREVGTWVGGAPAGLWNRAPAPELIGLDAQGQRATADLAPDEQIAFHTSIADAAHRPPPTEDGD